MKTGAIVPSSNKLARTITDVANLPSAKSIVEIGSGTGVFTQIILQRLPENAVFFALEINPTFVEETKKRCPDAIVYQDSVANISDYLKKHNINQCDCIISSVPIAGFRKKQQEQLLRTISNVLNPDGVFSTFTYLHSYLFPGGFFIRNFMKTMFKEPTKSKIIWRNFPPAFVYSYQK